jgi:hypothetical protein
MERLTTEQAESIVGGDATDAVAAAAGCYASYGSLAVASLAASGPLAPATVGGTLAVATIGCVGSVAGSV